MNICVVGLNHRKTPVEIRERLAISEKDLARALDAFPSSDPGLERVVLSTCNRVEVYLASEVDVDAVGVVSNFLHAFHGVDPSRFKEHLYVYEGTEAARHLFRVAGGLDSMVVGETQVLGQVKRAYLLAQERQATAKGLNKLFQYAFHVAKSVHSETSLASCHVSVSTVAASLAEKVFQDLSSRTALVIGAGETGQFTLEAFQARGVRRFMVANRTIERAEQAAKELEGQVVPLDRIGEALPRADIVISCVSREGATLTSPMLRAALATRKQPILVIDLSVPRSVDPASGQIEDIFLYNIDDLQTIATDNMGRHEKEVSRGEEIVERETRKFMSRVGLADIDRIVRELRAHFEAAAEEELRNMPAERRQEAEQAIRRLINKLLHGPLSALQDGQESQVSADLIRKLFRLR